jgi:hypothetical protein
MREVSATGFVVQPLNADKAQVRTFNFDEVKSIRALGAKRSHWVRNLVIVVVVVGALVGLGRLAYEKSGTS